MSVELSNDMIATLEPLADCDHALNYCRCAMAHQYKAGVRDAATWKRSEAELPPENTLIMISWGYDTPVIGHYEDGAFWYGGAYGIAPSKSRNDVFWMAIPKAPEDMP